MDTLPNNDPGNTTPKGGIIASVWGAVFVARFDVRGLQMMDLSRFGFVPSFMAAALVAPLHIIYLRSFYGQVEDPFNPAHAFMVESLAYVIGWGLIPVVMWEIAGWLDKRKNYWAFVVAYNWTAVIQNALMLPIVYFAMEGMFPTEFAQLLWLFGLVYILGLTGFVMVKTLGVTPIQASGLVAFDLMLGLMLNDLTNLMVFSGG